MKYVLGFFLIFSVNNFSFADEFSDGEKLIKGCSDLIGMYNNIEEQRVFSSITHSNSDALLAGYCLGVLKAVTRSSDYNCYRRSWYRLAEDLAGKWHPDMNPLSLESALGKVCYVR